MAANGRLGASRGDSFYRPLDASHLDVRGRPLKVGVVHYVQEMAQRIEAILLLGERLDENCEAVKEVSL